MIPLLVPTSAATDTPQAAALPSDLVGDDIAFAAAFAETGAADIHSDIPSEVEVELPLAQGTNDAETDIDESTKLVTGTDEPPQVDVATPVVAPVPVKKKSLLVPPDSGIKPDNPPHQSGSHPDKLVQPSDEPKVMTPPQQVVDKPQLQHGSVVQSVMEGKFPKLVETHVVGSKEVAVTRRDLPPVSSASVLPTKAVAKGAFALESRLQANVTYHIALPDKPMKAVDLSAAKHAQHPTGTPMVVTPQTSASIVQPANAVLVGLADAAKAELIEKVHASAAIDDVAFGQPAAERSIISVPVSAAAGTQSSGELARHAASQIAQVLANTNAKTTEISLNPEELGRVRLSMTAGDGAITLTIAAERPETSDLLRRHIDTLAQEFRDLGYDSLSFSFGASTDGDLGDGDGSPEDSTTEQFAEMDVAATPTLGSGQTSGLDLRL